MPIYKTLNQGMVPVKIFTEDIDQKSEQQLSNLASMPFIHSHVAAMPDVHFGIGATVGSVIPTKGAIIPAAVGVDIGCGMNAVKLSLTASDLPDSLKSIRSAIERRVPVGFKSHRDSVVQAATLNNIGKHLKDITDKHSGLLKMMGNFDQTWTKQIGTLGGGNHFIEICLDESEAVWIMLHSGSRGIGNSIGRYFIEKAKKDVGAQLGQLPDHDLAYFTEGTEHFDDYVQAVTWAQDYARFNRKEMMRLVIEALQKSDLPDFTVTNEAINCHHNYVERETHFGAEVYLTRKGAISAREGQLGIIPGSMGVKSYIVRGLGNAESFCSCSHGAGRQMSRAKARKTFNAADLTAQTIGVECRKDKAVVDEIPGAYKDIDTVMQNQTDLVEVVHTLKQVICVKG